MAITISGENNNDRILAQDGVIDQISGINIVGLITASHINVGSNIQLGNAGIVTATTFVGNLTGNVNSTSPLLLQTGGSERFRITSDNALGIAGANYGSSGQVLTSGGSGSAVTWSAIPTQVTIANNADNRVITGGSGVSLNGESNLTFDGSLLTVSGNLILHSGGATRTLQMGPSSAGIEYNVNGTTTLQGRTDAYPLAFKTQSVERLRITSDGRVGVGEASPSSDVTFTVRKDIAAASGNATMQINNLYQGTANQSNASGAEIEFKFKNHNASHNWWGGRILCYNSDNYNQYSYLRFDTASQGNAVERMRLNHDGDLTLFGKDNAELKLKCGSSSGNDIIAFQNSAGATRGNITYDSDNNFLLFNVNQGERLRIFSNGNVGVGDYSSTNLTHAFQALRTSGTTTISSKNTGGSALFYAEASGGNTAKLELMQAGVGNFTLEVGSTNALMIKDDGTEKVRIDSDGRMLLGSAAIQYAGSPLYVSGTDPVIGSFHHSDGGTNDQARIALGALANNPPYNRGVYLTAENNGSGHDFIVATSPSHSLGPTEKLRIASDGKISTDNAPDSDIKFNIDDSIGWWNTNTGLSPNSTRTWTITNINYGGAKILIGGGDGNYQRAGAVIEVVGTMWANNKSYYHNETIKNSSGASISTTFNNASIVISVTAGSNWWYYSMSIESHRRSSGAAFPTVTVS